MSRQILVLRSARHLHTALDALRRAFPDARLVVASNAGSSPLLKRVGVPAADRVIGGWTHLSPRELATDPAGRSLWRLRRDLTAVLLLDPDGLGYGNVVRTALCLSPRGFVAVTPDGAIVWHSGVRAVLRQAMAALTSAAVSVLVYGLLMAPARLLRAAGRGTP